VYLGCQLFKAKGLIMNKLLLAVAAAAATISAAPAFAIDAPAAAAPAAPKMSTADTTIGDLLDNPVAKAVLMKHVPVLAGNAQIEMARAMTLKQIQPMAGDALSDEVLAKIDVDLAAIK
jgi:para-nitrobenzyl esterase